MTPAHTHTRTLGRLYAHEHSATHAPVGKELRVLVRLLARVADVEELLMDPRPGGTGVVTDVGQHGSEEWRGGGEGTQRKAQRQQTMISVYWF